MHSILFKKYQDQSLASLYIANYNSQATSPELWVNEFQALITNLSDHPDILKIHKSANENEYKVDSPPILDFFKFINYRPLQLKKKFIFIFYAHDISLILSNKLLKNFEELGPNFCLFLMVPDNSYMLPTVLSRAIKLQIASSSKLVNKTSDFLGVNSPQDLLAILKQTRESGSSSSDEKQFIEQAIELRLSQCRELVGKSEDNLAAFKKLDDLLRILADFEKYSNFNNSKLARLTRFFP